MKLLNFSYSKILKNTLERDKLLNLVRWILIFSTIIWWWFMDNSPYGIALILVLSSCALIQMQFTNSPLLILIEQFSCTFVSLLWPGALFSLSLPAFETGVSGSLLSLLTLLGIILFKATKINIGMLLIIYLFAFFTGYILKAWNDRELLYKTAADRERRQRYELEKLRNELIVVNNEVGKLAEATERNRIAQQLHDNVGHELAGALIAIQTYKRLQENQDDRAQDMLENVVKRIEESSVTLRETVYKLKPNYESGAAKLIKLCEEFSYCELNYKFIGELDKVPSTHWLILEPCLKEALTNVSKYSSATLVEVKFDITLYIVRMNIRDNGIGAKIIHSGMGLFGIKERIRTAGGNVSIDGSCGFMLTCILPIDIYN